MIGQTILQYEILEKSRPELGSGRGCSFRSANGTALGEVRNFPTSVSSPEGMALPRVVENFRIPLKRSGSGRCGI
jgi:hypothetical protein